MYRLSRLPRRVLITTDEVIKQAAISDNPGINQLLNAIIIAEERFIKPAICKDLYYDFRKQKNVVVTDLNKDYLQELISDESGQMVTFDNGDIINAIEFVESDWYKELWFEHLWKITAEAVVYIASPTNYSRFEAAGEMENNPKVISNEGQGAASVDLNKMKWKMDKMLMDRIDPLLAGMQEWLSDNRGHFAYYNCHNLYRDDATGISTKRKTAWVNVYNDRRRTCC